MDFNLYKTSFLCSSDCYDKNRVVIAGIPMDFTVSFKPGSRFGPNKIREVSVGIEEYSVYQNKSLFDKQFSDLGDLELPFGNTKKALNMIYEVAKKLFYDGKLPIFLGGEHLISLPLIQAAFEKYGDLAIIHFDAHADMRDNYLGETLSHATVMRRVGEIVGFDNIYQFGIRSGSRDEIIFSKDHSHLFFIDQIDKFYDIIQNLKEKKIYLTLDIDVIDPAFAPATGTPEPIYSRPLRQSRSLTYSR